MPEMLVLVFGAVLIKPIPNQTKALEGALPRFGTKSIMSKARAALPPSCPTIASMQ